MSVTGKEQGPGPNQATGEEASFAGQGGYQKGPIDRGPYAQPETFSTHRRGPGGTSVDDHQSSGQTGPVSGDPHQSIEAIQKPEDLPTR